MDVLRTLLKDVDERLYNANAKTLRVFNDRPRKRARAAAPVASGSVMCALVYNRDAVNMQVLKQTF